jgi:hypothetical protein
MSSTTPNSYDAWFTAAVTPADKLEELKQINIYVEDVRNAEAADEADELIDIATEIAQKAYGKIPSNIDLVSSFTVPGFFAKRRGESTKVTGESPSWILTPATVKKNGLALRVDGAMSIFHAIPLEKKLGKNGTVLSTPSDFFKRFVIEGYDTLAVNASRYLVIEKNVAAVKHYLTNFMIANSGVLKP